MAIPLSPQQYQKLISTGKTPDAIAQAAARNGFSLPSSTEKAGGISGSLARFTGSEKLGQGIGYSLFQLTPEYKSLQSSFDQGQVHQALAAIRDPNTPEESRVRLKKLIQDQGVDPDELTHIMTGGLTSKEIIGSGIQTAANIATVGTLSRARAAATVASEAAANASRLNQVRKGAIAGAKVGALQQGIRGGVGGVGEALQNDDSIQDTIAEGITGGAKGALGGAAFGGVTGGISAPLAVRAARKQELRDLLIAEQEGRSASRAGDAIFAASGPNKGILPAESPAQAFSKESAPYRLDRLGNVEKDPVFKEAFKATAIPAEDLALVKASGPDDRSAYKDMINLARTGQDDVFNVTRPVERAGKTFLSRVKFIGTQQKEAAGEIDKTARETLQGRHVNGVDDAVKEFEDSLSHRGIGITEGEKGPTLEFSGSDFEDLPAVQRVLSTVYKRAQQLAGDGYKAHQIKRFIDEQVNYGKAAEGLTGNAERLLKSFRRSVDGALDKASSSYNTANQRYSIAQGAQEQVSRLLGRDFASSDYASLRAGEVMNRILGNAAARPLTVLNDVEKASRQLGGRFSDNVVAQVRFADLLDDIIGQPSRSLGGNVERAINRTLSIKGILTDAANLKFGDIGADVLKKMAEKTPEERLAALETYLSKIKD